MARGIGKTAEQAVELWGWGVLATASHIARSSASSSRSAPARPDTARCRAFSRDARASATIAWWLPICQDTGLLRFSGCTTGPPGRLSRGHRPAPQFPAGCGKRGHEWLEQPLQGDVRVALAGEERAVKGGEREAG